jgi:hypothetical protein
MIKRMKQLFSGKNKDGFVVKSRKKAAFGEQVDQYAEAATFAEAGLLNEATEIMRRESEERPKVLVVGNQENFSRALSDYAVGFARRMSYDIIALSCLPLGEAESSKAVDPFRDVLRENFESKASEGVTTLKDKAVEAGVDMRHVVKFGSVDGCMKEVNREFKRVEFVLTEPEAGIEDGRAPAIPVFCLAS